MSSKSVLANREEGSTDRGRWRRQDNGRWQRITDGRISINDGFGFSSRILWAADVRPAHPLLGTPAGGSIWHRCWRIAPPQLT
jgi:hypothetical protein